MIAGNPIGFGWPFSEPLFWCPAARVMMSRAQCEAFTRRMHQDLNNPVYHQPVQQQNQQAQNFPEPRISSGPEENFTGDDSASWILPAAAVAVFLMFKKKKR